MNVSFGKFGRVSVAKRVYSGLWDYSYNNSGNIGLMFGLFFGMAAVVGAVAIDYSTIVSARADLQAAVDAAATASARELYVMDADNTQVRAVANSIATAKLATERTIKSFVVDASVNQDRSAVTATIKSNPQVNFSSLLGTSDPTITVEATAKILGTGRICMITLDPSGAGALSLDKNARVTAIKCSIFSNSGHSAGIKAYNLSRVKAEMTCSAGGVKGAASNFSPKAETDCPVIEDPLAARPAPPVGACSKTNLLITSGSHTLSPGVYCGGLEVTKTAKVTLKPGVYVIKDGPLLVDKDAKLSGQYVGFYFTGAKSILIFKPNTHIDLGAPKDGPLAGLLFFGDRKNKIGKKYRIESNDARNLLGTIYFPNGALEIEANGPVADKSAYTVVVSHSILLSEGPEFVLNANYSSTDVPVPSGIGPVGSNIVLTK